MNIDRITEQDLPELSRLYTQFWNEESSLEKMRKVFKKMEKNQSYIILGAKRKGMLVGSVLGVICDELYGDCKPFMVVEDVVVDENHRRKGVASLLMKKIEKIAIENDCGNILFVTESERIEAQKFYESLGYKSDPYKGFKKKLSYISQQQRSPEHQGAARLSSGDA